MMMMMMMMMETLKVCTNSLHPVYNRLDKIFQWDLWYTIITQLMLQTSKILGRTESPIISA